MQTNSLTRVTQFVYTLSKLIRLKINPLLKHPLLDKGESNYTKTKKANLIHSLLFLSGKIIKVIKPFQIHLSVDKT